MRMPWTSEELPEPEKRAEIQPHSPAHVHMTTAGDKAIAYVLSLFHWLTWYRFCRAGLRGAYMITARLRSWINVDDKPQLAQAGTQGALQHASESKLRRLIVVVVFGTDLVLLLATMLHRGAPGHGLLTWGISWLTVMWVIAHGTLCFIVGRDGPVLNRVQTARMTGEYLLRSVINEITIPPTKMKLDSSVTTVLKSPIQRLSTDRGWEATVKIHDQGDPMKLLSYAGTTSLAHKMEFGRQTVYTYKVAKNQSLVRIMVLDEDPWTLPPTPHPMAMHPRPWNIWRESANLGYHPGSYPWLEPLLREGRGRNILIGGSPGAGKSVLIRNILMYLVPSGANIHLIDGKSVDFLPLKRIAKSYVGETDMEDEALLHRVIKVMEDVKSEVNRRKKIILDSAEAHGTPTYLTEEMSNTLGMPPEFVIIDELATFTEEMRASHPKLVQKILDLIRYIASKGRAFGVQFLLATQRPNDKSVPSPLRGLFTWRIAFYIGNQAGSFAVIEKSGDEYRADKLEPPSMDDDSMDYRLVAINAHLRNPVRVHLGRDSDLRFVVDYAVALKSHQRNPGSSTLGRYPVLVEKVLEIFAEHGYPDRLETAILMTRMREFTPESLAKALKPFNITPKRWSERNQDKRGYLRAEFERVPQVPVASPTEHDGPAGSATGPSGAPGESHPPEDDIEGWAAQTDR